MTSEEFEAKYINVEGAYAGVGDGWLPLVDDCLQELLANKIAFKISTIKEKFGGLRLYIDTEPGDNWRNGQDIITKYECKSFVVCEECGRPGHPRKGGWIKTLCTQHAYGRAPWLPRYAMDHTCKASWQNCPECNKPICSDCSWACYQCVKAYRHKECSQKHFEATKHDGWMNDLVLLLELAR